MCATNVHIAIINNNIAANDISHTLSEAFDSAMLCHLHLFCVQMNGAAGNGEANKQRILSCFEENLLAKS